MQTQNPDLSSLQSLILADGTAIHGIYQQNNLLFVCPDGKIYRNMNGQWGEAVIYESNGYCCISWTDQRVQHNAYAHRIVAEAYLPNPEHFPNVSFLNGDPKDLRPENLIWKEPVGKYKGGHRPVLRICPICSGEIRMPNKEICSNCYQRMRIRRAQIISAFEKAEKTDTLRQEMDDYNIWPHLTEKKKEIIQLYLSYANISRVAEAMNVSRQYVSDVIIDIHHKTEMLRKGENVNWGVGRPKKNTVLTDGSLSYESKEARKEKQREAFRVLFSSSNVWDVLTDKHKMVCSLYLAGCDFGEISHKLGIESFSVRRILRTTAQKAINIKRGIVRKIGRPKKAANE